MRRFCFVDWLGFTNDRDSWLGTEGLRLFRPLPLPLTSFITLSLSLSLS
jgi:hypothetical protein